MGKIYYDEVVEDVPDEPYVAGVFTIADPMETRLLNGDPKTYRFIAYHRTPGGSSTTRHETREQAEESLARVVKSHQDFWEEKVRIARSTSIATNADESVPIRVGGHHYMAVPDKIVNGGRRQAGLGHSGDMFYWRWLHPVDGDRSIKVFRSNNVWSQGTIPPDFQDRLPDNAVWATREEWEAQQEEVENTV